MRDDAVEGRDQRRLNDLRLQQFHLRLRGFERCARAGNLLILDRHCVGSLRLRTFECDDRLPQRGLRTIDGLVGLHVGCVRRFECGLRDVAGFIERHIAVVNELRVGSAACAVG